MNKMIETIEEVNPKAKLFGTFHKNMVFKIKLENYVKYIYNWHKM